LGTEVEEVTRFGGDVLEFVLVVEFNDIPMIRAASVNLDFSRCQLR
jgi:hypothetical protein